jgi:hypothetical protein
MYSGVRVYMHFDVLSLYKRTISLSFETKHIYDHWDSSFLEDFAEYVYKH